MHKELKLSNGFIALVDAFDYPILSKYKWYKSSYGYAIHKHYRDGRSIAVLMHKMLVCPPKGMYVDHINGDKLDNRRQNLRAATPRQNSYNAKLSVTNTTGFKGTRFLARTGRYSAQLRVNGKAKHLGYFTTVEEAHAAYCRAAIERDADFARFA